MENPEKTLQNVACLSSTLRHQASDPNASRSLSRKHTHERFYTVFPPTALRSVGGKSNLQLFDPNIRAA
jgi:hypothetical protein